VKCLANFQRKLDVLRRVDLSLLDGVLYYRNLFPLRPVGRPKLCRNASLAELDLRSGRPRDIDVNPAAVKSYKKFESIPIDRRGIPNAGIAEAGVSAEDKEAVRTEAADGASRARIDFPCPGDKFLASLAFRSSGMQHLASGAVLWRNSADWKRTTSPARTVRRFLSGLSAPP
jgi:hypothetical protein